MFLASKVKDFSSFSGIDVEKLIRHKRGKSVDEFIKLFSEMPEDVQKDRKDKYGAYYNGAEIGINDLYGSDENLLSNKIYHELTHFIVDEYNLSRGIKRGRTNAENYKRIHNTPVIDKLKTLVESAKSKYREAGKKPHKEEFYNQFEPEEALAYFTGGIGMNSKYYNIENEDDSKTISGFFNRIRNKFFRKDTINRKDKSDVSDVFSVMAKELGKYRASHKILTPFNNENGEAIMKDANSATKFDLEYHRQIINDKRKANSDLRKKFAAINANKENPLHAAIANSLSNETALTDRNNELLRTKSVLSKNQKTRREMGWEDSQLLIHARRLGIDLS